jgi:NADPH:quinone reductase-like Zn-dependent oxidoreductase
MKAAVFQETGGPEVLRVENLDPPAPGDGEVLVEVRAASVNPYDAKVREGKYAPELPAFTGTDMSGTVVESNSPDFSAGDDVFGWARSGAAAELATASAELIAAKPPGVSHEEAAAIPVAGGTAWQALFDSGGLQNGQSALIAGAAGGVGHFAIQFASHAGARVTGSGSSRNREFVLGLGADEYIDYTEQDVSEAATGIDVAFDTVGGKTTATLVPTLAEGGVLVTIAGDPPEEAAAERGARAELLVSSAGREQIVRIAELIDAGEVRVEIAETFRLAEIQRAHELIDSGHTRGKILLRIDS